MKSIFSVIELFFKGTKLNIIFSKQKDTKTSYFLLIAARHILIQ